MILVGMGLWGCILCISQVLLELLVCWVDITYTWLIILIIIECWFTLLESMILTKLSFSHDWLFCAYEPYLVHVVCTNPYFSLFPINFRFGPLRRFVVIEEEDLAPSYVNRWVLMSFKDRVTHQALLVLSMFWDNYSIIMLGLPCSLYGNIVID